MINRPAMANLLLDDSYDRFGVMYDIALLISEENVKTESAIISAVHLTSAAVSQIISFMLNQGYIKTTKSDSEFRMTIAGLDFIKEFQGLRNFLS
jgi:predicted transcriptional regulator